MTKWALPAFKCAVPLVLAYFIGRQIHGNWEQVRAETWQLDGRWLALSFFPAAGWYLLRPLGWALLLRGFGHNVGYGELYRVFRKAELSRYVPGGIWQFASRIYLTRRFGVGSAACVAATLLDTILAGLGAIVPATWLAASGLTTLGTWQRVALAVFPLLAMAFVYPRVLNAWAQPLSRLLKQPYTALQTSAGRMLGIWAMYAGVWIGLAFGMACYARALLPSLTLGQLAYVAGSYALAWLAALVTMIAPAGMGVREGILGLLLSRIVAAGTAMTLAVAMRLWIILMELAWLAACPLMPLEPPEDPHPGH